MKQTRREFIKANAVAATAAAAGITIPGAQALAKSDDSGVRWDKAPCRFCGTGCSVLVGTKDDRVVATMIEQPVPQKRQAAFDHLRSVSLASVTSVCASAGSGRPTAAAAAATACALITSLRVGWLITGSLLLQSLPVRRHRRLSGDKRARR